MSTSWQMEPLFLPSHDGSQRLCIFHAARGRCRGGILYVHPFAEEMNKSRRMAALQARSFAELGFAVLQIDLLGCGDSSGDFGDATWSAWQADLDLARQHLESRSANGQPSPLYLWGLRAGCLLASSAAQRWGDVAGQIWWQPPASGNTLLQQWLRLKVASQLQATGDKDSVQSLRAKIDAGVPIEIGGYVCSPALLAGLGAATLAPPRNGAPIAWFEVSRAEPPSLLPASTKLLEVWRQADHPVGADAIDGPMFWQSTEIETAPMLLERTARWASEISRAVPA